MKARVALLLALAGALPGQQPNREGQRLALVVANSDYVNLDKLRAPAAERDLVRTALADSGFTVQTIDNMRFPDFVSEAEGFLKKVQPGDTVLFFFSGYAVQGDDDNYLLPVNFDPQSTLDLEQRAYHLSRVQEGLADRKAGLKVFLVSAAHKIDKNVRGMTGPGLMNPPNVLTDSLFGFSASAGQTVSGRDTPDLFVRAIVRSLAQPGLHVTDVLNAAVREVVNSSGETQIPLIQNRVVHDRILRQAPLTVKPNSLAFTAPAYNAAPPTQSLTAYAGGYAGNFVVSVPPEARWLAVTPAQGQMTSAESPNITVSVDPLNLTPGNKYTATLRIAANSSEWNPEPKDVDITFDVPSKPPEQRQGPMPNITYSNRTDREVYMYIPAADFLMGCASADTRCEANEKPQHMVTISKGFFLGRNEVEVDAYRKFVSQTGRKMPTAPLWDKKWEKEGDLPVADVNWAEADRYCAWAGGRLPTEAEWELAARAGKDDEVYPLNDENSRDKANFYGRHGNDIWEDTPAPVRKFDPNAFGLYDMAGNVWEFVADYYAADYYSNSERIDPKGPATGKDHVKRGGSWYSDAQKHLRISIREKQTGGENITGFRCAMDDTPAARNLLDIPLEEGGQPEK